MADPSALSLAPRARRTKLGRYVNTITRQELEACFHMPSADAASLLGVGSTMLKRVCRKFGINRWPYRGKPAASPGASKQEDQPPAQPATSSHSTSSSGGCAAVRPPAPQPRCRAAAAPQPTRPAPAAGAATLPQSAAAPPAHSAASLACSHQAAPASSASSSVLPTQPRDTPQLELQQPAPWPVPQPALQFRAVSLQAQRCMLASSPFQQPGPPLQAWPAPTSPSSIFMQWEPIQLLGSGESDLAELLSLKPPGCCPPAASEAQQPQHQQRAQQQPQPQPPEQAQPHQLLSGGGGGRGTDLAELLRQWGADEVELCLPPAAGAGADMDADHDGAAGEAGQHYEAEALEPLAGPLSSLHSLFESLDWRLSDLDLP